MKKSIAKALHEKSEDQGNWDGEMLSLRKTYSGRGMYGKDTWAVSGDEYTFHKCLSECVVDIIEAHDDENYDMDNLAKKVKEFLDGSLHAQTDSMGMGMVWY